MKKIGCFLRLARETRELTQREVERATGINAKTLSNWENDRAYPSPADLVDLSRCYSVSVDMLVGNVDANWRALLPLSAEAINIVKHLKCLDTFGIMAMNRTLEGELARVRAMNQARKGVAPSTSSMITENKELTA